ncbi:MAG: bifunctional folylpolyglutamate synthase/dihydrofolate synthase [Bacteroidales bacterium]|nr:bifunctional folylpolyglutamate synthase/dihydrofolate synthase [Bacteroidales bacterium]
MTQQEYQQEIDFIFNRFPSYQKVGKVAYKPGIETMQALDELLGHPHRSFRTIHVAGTNGKGSTSHMLAAALQKNYKVGLYTSPHLVDFRERMKVNGEMVPQEFVYSFLQQYKEKFTELGASFFEITTALAFAYFAHEQVDIAVIECGLGGRLDSTNIITPELCVITNIGLDHCEHLGYTLAEVAAEKAGIIKQGIPVVVSEKGSAEVENVFREKATEVGAPIFFAEEVVETSEAAGKMYRSLMEGDLDLKGACQEKNLKGVCTALNILEEKFCAGGECSPAKSSGRECSHAKSFSAEGATVNIRKAAEITGLRGRWETLKQEPLTICDTGHNSHGFKVLGAQISATAAKRRELYPQSRLHMVFGVVADKDLDSIVEYLPKDAYYWFVNAKGTRALPSDKLCARMKEFGFEGEAVTSDIATFLKGFAPAKEDFVFIGGSTFVVAEALI